MWITGFFYLPVCSSGVDKVVISFVIIENSTVGNVVVSFVGDDSNDKDSVVYDADVDVNVIYYDKLKDVVDRSFSLFKSFF